MKRRIAVVTGGRAEYGLLAPLLRRLAEMPGIELQLIVCAAHLASEFGSTKNAIVADGYRIDAEVEMLVAGDSPAAMANSLGLGCIGFADAFERLAPDVLVVLGDRFEILAAVQTALLLRIPVAHLHGGELTEGAVDDSMRHAITKMSHLHFTAAEEYARRVIQMGEQPDRVFNVGAIGLDTVRALEPMSRHELEAEFKLPAGRRIILATLHPETLSLRSPQQQIRPLLNVLTRRHDYTVVMTYPNADFGGRAMIAEIEEFARSHPHVVAIASFGQRGYLSAMAAADVVMGNSSSGIIEAPAVGVAVVNIGDRQKGRLRAPSVIDCVSEEAAIECALETALSPQFLERAKIRANPYGDGHAASKIVDVLCGFPLDRLLQKAFYSEPSNSPVRAVKVDAPW